MAGDATIWGPALRYRGDDRRRTAPPEEGRWRAASAGLLGGVLLVALMLRRPNDAVAAADQENLLLAVTAVLAAAAAVALLVQHAISGRSHELLSGWALGALSVGHLGLVAGLVETGPLLGTRGGPVAFAVGHGLAVACFAVRAAVPPIEPWARRIVLAGTAGAAAVGAALVATGLGRGVLHGLARPASEGPLGADLVLAALWVALAVAAVRRPGRTTVAWVDPLVVVLVGSALAVLAPAFADLTGGDPGRSRLVLAFGTSLCAAAMSVEALWHMLRTQDARLLASEVERVVADQALEAERAARSELDHDLTAALLAVEGAARALEHRERAEHPSGSDQPALATAIASEISRLQQLLGGVDLPASAGRFALGPAILPVITCDLAKGVDIRAEVPSGLVARGSALATAQVVRNLLDNAQRHAPGAPVRISAGQDGAWVYVRVEDAGPGVPVPARSRIFERGVQAGSGSGSGLGLFVASRLMLEQGGDLALEDTRPTSFRLRLPAAGGGDGG